MTKYRNVYLKKNDETELRYEKVANIDFVEDSILITEYAIQNDLSIDRRFRYIPIYKIKELVWDEVEDD